MSVLPVCPEHAHRSEEVSVDTRRGAALAVVAPQLIQRKERPEKVTVEKVRHTILNCSLHAYVYLYVYVYVHVYIYIYICIYLYLYLHVSVFVSVSVLAAALMLCHGRLD